MDIISLVPIEIAERIFMYLEPKDLANCCAVNKSWYCLANSDRCWRKICTDCEVEENDHLYAGHPNRWKELYKNHAILLRNWGTNTYKKYNMHCIGDAQVMCSTVYGSTLVVGYTNNEVGVYAIKKTKVKSIQCLGEMLDQPDVIVHAVVANSKIIAAKFGTVILIYTNAGANFSFSHLLYTDGDDPKLICSRYKKTIKHAVNVGTTILDCSECKESMGLAGNTLFLYMKNVSRVFLWDYVKLECKVDIEVYPQLCSIVYFKDRLYLGNCNRILVYNKNCERELSIDVEHVIKRLFCNKNIILGQVGGDKLCAWNRKNGELLYCRMMSIPDDCVLHPKNDVVIYLLYSRRPPPEVDKREIKAYNLQTEKICWKTPVQKSHFNVIGHAFHIVVGRYLIFYTPSFGRMTETWSVYDTLNGKYLYTIEKDSDILLCSDKLIMLRKDYSSTVKIQLYT